MEATPSPNLYERGYTKIGKIQTFLAYLVNKTNKMLQVIGNCETREVLVLDFQECDTQTKEEKRLVLV